MKNSRILNKMKNIDVVSFSQAATMLPDWEEFANQ